MKSLVFLALFGILLVNYGYAQDSSSDASKEELIELSQQNLPKIDQSRIDAEQDRRFDKVERLIDNLERKIDRVDERINDLEYKIGDIRRKL